ncbi:MAG: 2Fe-2S iron-sulfur cluster binding domain-containing protein [Angelakisella sp.]|jgi:NADP-reducing hydrogenase subunit HndD|nr:2Fe-2S iron-sulfur cluster binding domain-containing protein [Angelakisella sp.]
MKMVNLTINGLPVTVPEGTTILEAARKLAIDIPTLCFLKEINEIGACRICVVEVKGMKNLVASCVYPVAEGMEVLTNSKRVFASRKIDLELILSTHKKKCLSCVRSGNCELQKLCKDFRVYDEDVYAGENPKHEFDDTAKHMYRDNDKCVLCRRCVAACQKWQSVGVIGPNDRGFATHIGCAFEQSLADVACVSCGQCIVVCPTGAIAEKDNTRDVWRALSDPRKHVVVQTAPSIRVTLGEAFDMPIGTNVKGKMVSALRRLGFDGVFDTDLAADMTIVEEANELVERIKKGGTLPMITSCSPGWVNYCEHYYPEFVENLSTCKSPQQMFGALTKTWYAKRMGLDPKDIFVVGIMPCTAKKFEVAREDEAAAGVPDVDVALTTRELARMIDRAGINFAELPDEEFDDPMGVSTGAAVIFGATGGVMEAALRTAAEWITGSDAAPVDFVEVRGVEGVKEAVYQVGDLTLNVAVASGLANAKKLLDSIKSGEKTYHFIEIMGCPGGCVNGGGQPVQPARIRNWVDLKSLRAAALYEEDKNLPIRKSHENPVLKQIYKEFLKTPGSHVAHQVLHTSYRKLDRFHSGGPAAAGTPSPALRA